MKNNKKVIFLIDFDITISKRDSTDTLLSVYQPELKADIRKKYRSGEITMKEYLQTGIESLNITKEEFLETLGYNVNSLKRIKVGELTLGHLQVGEYRALNEDEIKYLKSL